MQEESFLVNLVVKVPGYGKGEHQRKLAQNILRILELSLHQHVTVEMRKPDGTFVTVKRDDRNATSVDAGDP